MFERETAIKRIKNSIRELDRSDCEAICILIKECAENYDMVNIVARGTDINLDKIDDKLLQQIDNMVITKLQRIHCEQF